MNALVAALPGLVPIFVLAGGVNALAGVLLIYNMPFQNVPFHDMLFYNMLISKYAISQYAISKQAILQQAISQYAISKHAISLFPKYSKSYKEVPIPKFPKGQNGMWESFFSEKVEFQAGGGGWDSSLKKRSDQI